MMESAVIAISILFLLLSFFVITIAVINNRRQRKNRAERQQLQHQFDEALLKTQIEIQEQTLKKISQEIHDNIGQTLSLAKLNLNTMNPDRQELAAQKVANSKDLVAKAIQDLRSLSKTMNTDAILSSGLLRAIEYELQLLEKGGEFKTDFTIQGTPAKIDPGKELIAFRIIQEALNNIIKHAKADEVKIVTGFTGHSVQITVSDNGKGFEPAQAEPDLASGSGLANMSSRAALIGGSLSIQTSGLSGTTINLIIPITNYETNDSTGR